MLTDERIKELLTPVFIKQDQASIHWPDIFEEARAIEAEVCRVQNAESERQDGLSLTDATQRIAELETEAAENCRIIGMSGEREARHLARIAELEKVAQAYEDQVAAHNKTLDELARLAELIDEQKGTIRALNMALGGDGSPSTENLIDANEIDAGDKGLIALCREQAEQAELIDKCSEFLEFLWREVGMNDFAAEKWEELTEAIAAQKGGAA